MGLFEAENLPRSARQIDQAGVNERDSNMMGEDVDRTNTQQHFRGRNGFV